MKIVYKSNIANLAKRQNYTTYQFGKFANYKIPIVAHSSKIVYDIVLYSLIKTKYIKRYKRKKLSLKGISRRIKPFNEIKQHIFY